MQIYQPDSAATASEPEAVEPMPVFARRVTIHCHLSEQRSHTTKPANDGLRQPEPGNQDKSEMNKER